MSLEEITNTSYKDGADVDTRKDDDDEKPQEDFFFSSLLEQ